MRLSIYKLASVLISLLAFAYSSIANPIPFSLKRGVPEIQAYINDSIKAALIFDTGADQVYLDRAFADSNNLLFGTKLPVRPTSGIDQKVEAFRIFLKSLKVGSTNQKLVNTVIIDLNAIVRDTSKGLPDGVLGNSFLNNQQIYLNYIDSTLEFLENDSVFADQKAAIIPFIRNRHLITLNATVNDSVEAKFILDTGASYSIISPALAERLNLEDSSMVNKIKIGGKVTTSNVRVLIKDMGGISQSVNDVEFDGVLGTTFLTGRELIINYPKSLLSIFPVRE